MKSDFWSYDGKTVKQTKKYIGALLREMRKANKVSIADLARDSGISAKDIQALEAGTGGTLDAFAHCLNAMFLTIEIIPAVKNIKNLSEHRVLLMLNKALTKDVPDD